MKYQVITDAGLDGGLDEKRECNRLADATEAAREYVADGYDGAGIFSYKRQRIIWTVGYFREWQM